MQLRLEAQCQVAVAYSIPVLQVKCRKLWGCVHIYLAANVR